MVPFCSKMEYMQCWFSAIPPKEGKCHLKKHDLCVFYYLIFLLLVMPIYFKYPYFQTNTHKVNLQNNVYSEKQILYICLLVFPDQKENAASHVNYKVRYDGTLFVCTALMALNLL